ncbi:unnamed protein product [Sphagnum balticum]
MQCLSSPCSFGTCTDTGYSGDADSYYCNCTVPYRTYAGSSQQCNDYDECAVYPCMNNGVCTDNANDPLNQGKYYPGPPTALGTVGGRTCACVTGWTGVDCETMINHCDPNPCWYSAYIPTSAANSTMTVQLTYSGSTSITPAQPAQPYNYCPYAPTMCVNNTYGTGCCKYSLTPIPQLPFISGGGAKCVAYTCTSIVPQRQ